MVQPNGVIRPETCGYSSSQSKAAQIDGLQVGQSSCTEWVYCASDSIVRKLQLLQLREALV